MPDQTTSRAALLVGPDPSEADELDQGVEGGLGFHLAVEEEGVVGAAADGEMVQPGLAVVEAPEGDAGDGFLISEVDGENPGIAAGEFSRISSGRPSA